MAGGTPSPSAIASSHSAVLYDIITHDLWPLHAPSRGVVIELEDREVPESPASGAAQSASAMQTLNGSPNGSGGGRCDLVAFGQRYQLAHDDAEARQLQCTIGWLVPPKTRADAQAPHPIALIWRGATTDGMPWLQVYRVAGTSGTVAASA